MRWNYFVSITIWLHYNRILCLNWSNQVVIKSMKRGWIWPDSHFCVWNKKLDCVCRFEWFALKLPKNKDIVHLIWMWIYDGFSALSWWVRGWRLIKLKPKKFRNFFQISLGEKYREFVKMPVTFLNNWTQIISNFKILKCLLWKKKEEIFCSMLKMHLPQEGRWFMLHWWRLNLIKSSASYVLHRPAYCLHCTNKFNTINANK